MTNNIRILVIINVFFLYTTALSSVCGWLGMCVRARFVQYMACLIVIFVGEIIGGVLAILFKDMVCLPMLYKFADMFVQVSAILV